jgi:ribosome-associated translation inhibitor RaiA
MSQTVESQSAAVSVEFVGESSAAEREYAVRRIDSLTRYASIHAARVVITRDGDPCDPRWVEARVNLRGDRLFVHAGARGSTTREALDLVRQRLYRLLTHERHHPQHARSRGTARFGRQN